MFDVSPDEENQFKASLALNNKSFKSKIEEDDDYDTPEETNKSVPKLDSDGFKIPDKPTLTLLLNNNETKETNEQKHKKLDTPLAAMLPSKYADLDVTELFPEFRHNQVLRFSRLFGPGKPSSLPQVWKNVKNKRKKRPHDIIKETVIIIKTMISFQSIDIFLKG